MEVNLILLRNMPKDSNGLLVYMFATDKQVEQIIKLRNNPEKRNSFVKLGNYTFSPIDILYIKKEKDYGGAIPKYFLERYNNEKQLASGNEIPSNC